MRDFTVTTTFSRPLEAPSSALYRSRIEIARILDSISREGGTLSAEINEEKFFMTQLMNVDEAADHVDFAFGPDKTTNRLVLKLRSLEFEANHQGTHITFEVAAPREAMRNGEPAIRYPLPHSLMQTQRREHPRIPVPADVSVRCIADAGGIMPFEVRITDISLAGMGGMVYERGIQLTPGMILKGCRIMVPNHDAIVVDLEVRNSNQMTMLDGRPAARAGVRFVKRPRGIDKLIDRFVHDLDTDSK